MILKAKFARSWIRNFILKMVFKRNLKEFDLEEEFHTGF